MPKRRILRSLQLDKIAAVDSPCQEGATMMLIKRADELLPLIKSADPIAQGFATLYATRKAEEDRWDVENSMFPVFNALRESMTSIVTDTHKNADEKAALRDASIAEFKKAIQAEWPEFASKIEKVSEAKPEEPFAAAFIKAGSPGAKSTKGVSDMDNNDKKVAELEKAVTTKDAEIAKLTAERDEALKKAEASSDDEILTIGDKTISKAKVGGDVFAAFKAQGDELAKEREDAENARIEKRVADDFGSVPGEDAHKAGVLKAIEAIEDEDVRKAGISIFSTLEKLVSASFQTLGHSDPTVTKGAKDFEAEVLKIKARDTCSKTEAMQKARKEHPELFEAYQGASAN